MIKLTAHGNPVREPCHIHAFPGFAFPDESTGIDVMYCDHVISIHTN